MSLRMGPVKHVTQGLCGQLNSMNAFVTNIFFKVIDCLKAGSKPLATWIVRAGKPQLLPLPIEMLLMSSWRIYPSPVFLDPYCSCLKVG